MTMGDVNAQLAACTIARARRCNELARALRRRAARAADDAARRPHRAGRAQRDRRAGPTARRRSSTTSTRTASTSPTCGSRSSSTIRGDEVIVDLSRLGADGARRAQLDALVHRGDRLPGGHVRGQLRDPDHVRRVPAGQRRHEARHGRARRDAGRLDDARRHRLPHVRRGQRRARAADPAPRAGGGRGRQHARDLRRRRPAGEPFIYFELVVGTWGARPTADGNDGLCNPCRDGREHPGRGGRVGVPDQDRALRARPRQRRRGSFPRRARDRAHVADARRRTRRCRCAPTGRTTRRTGCTAGCRAACSANEVANGGGPRARTRRCSRRRSAAAPSTTTAWPAAAAGATRSSATRPRSRDDVRNEKVGAASAREDYGVVLRDDGAVDDGATEALRASRRRA